MSTGPVRRYRRTATTDRLTDLRAVPFRRRLSRDGASYRRLWRLYETGLLQNIKRISSVSGGSIHGRPVGAGLTRRRGVDLGEGTQAGGGSRRSKPKWAGETTPSAANRRPRHPARQRCKCSAGRAAGHGAGPARERANQSRQTPAILDSRGTGRAYPVRPHRRPPCAEVSAVGRRLGRLRADPGVVQDVLITPHKKATAAVVAQMIPLG